MDGWLDGFLRVGPYYLLCYLRKNYVFVWAEDEGEEEDDFD